MAVASSKLWKNCGKIVPQLWKNCATIVDAIFSTILSKFHNFSTIFAYPNTIFSTICAKHNFRKGQHGGTKVPMSRIFLNLLPLLLQFSCKRGSCIEIYFSRQQIPDG